MLRRFFLLAALAAPLAAQQPAARQPVLILLYSRHQDFLNVEMEEDRIKQTLALLQWMRETAPATKPQALMTMTGLFAEKLYERNARSGVLDMVRQAMQEGYVQIGYDGEHEPTYRNRPKPDLKNAKTPEQRWLAYSTAAERLLRDYKAPLTGEPDPKRRGGLAKVQELLGPAAFVANITRKLGGDAPYVHQWRRLNSTALAWGVPDPDPLRGIHGYRAAATDFGTTMTPTPECSPELYWESGVLRVSDTGSDEMRRFMGEEGADKLKELLGKLDRRKPRVLRLEVGSYHRYLTLHEDGTPKYPPLAYAFDNPDEPVAASGVPVFRRFAEVAMLWQKEKDTLDWLLREWLPENAGSRFVSVKDLARAAASPLAAPVSQQELRAAAEDLARGFEARKSGSNNFVFTGRRYFSAAELFHLLAASLAALGEQGKLPESVEPKFIYGPIDFQRDPGPSSGEVTVKDVIDAAARLAPLLGDPAWRPVPSNAVPVWVNVGKLKVNAVQFLKLMNDAYLAPDPAKTLNVTLRTTQMQVTAYPTQIPHEDMGSLWTMRPAVLDLAALK